MATFVSREYRMTVFVSLAACLTCSIGCDRVASKSRNAEHPPVANISAAQDKIDGRGEKGHVGRSDGDQAVPLVTLPFLENGLAIVVPVTIDGMEYPFFLDTGTSRTVYDVSLKNKLGRFQGFIRVSTAAAPIIVETRDAPDASLGKVQLARVTTVSCMDLEPYRKALGCDIRGILGVPLLRQFIVHLDWDNHVVRIFKSTTQPDADWGTPIHAWLSKGPSLLIEGTFDVQTSVGKFNALSAPLNVDTGKNGSLAISQRHIRALFERKQIRLTGTGEAFTAGGQKTTFIGFLRKLGIGPFEHGNVGFNEARTCVVGLKYLSRYCVTIDVQNNRIFLKPGRRYAFRYDYEPSGLYCRDEHTHFVVTYEEPDTPVYRAGLRVGDHIVKVSGRPASVFSDPKLQDWLDTRQGAPIALTCRRNGELHDFTFQLERLQLDYDAPQGAIKGATPP